MRIWLPDRPGAFGAVATRIGGAGGDLVGIDILERGGGRVIDELTIDLPDEGLIPVMLRAVREVEGVDVEDIRSVIAGLPYPIVDPLEVAVDLLTGRSIEELFAKLVTGVCNAFSSWAAVVEPDGPVVLAASDDAPARPWIEAFVTGTRHASGNRSSTVATNDVAWASLEVSELALLAGRSGRPFRARERRQLATLSRVADHRWRELVVRENRRAHPASHA